MTLVEIAIAGLVSAVILAAFTAIVYSVQTVVSREEDRSTNNDQARLGMELMDRDIRSGNVIYAPSDYILRVYTQSNREERCVQYAIHERELLRREWPPTPGTTTPDPADVSSWRSVAEAIVNVEEGIPVFARPTSRTIDITLLVNSAYDARPDSMVGVETSITGRNTEFSTATDACDTPPPLGL